MYWLLNFLFGWDYVYWESSTSSGVARVVILHDGKVAYWPYSFRLVVISEPSGIVWLTCSSSKYFS